MKIREATATDNVLAREIVQASLATFGLTAEFEAGGQDDAVGRLGSGENAVELVAELDGVVVGCVVVRAGPGKTAKLFGFHVAQAMRGRGVGRALLVNAIAKARAAGIATLKLDTLREMEAAVHLYESLGWELDGDAVPADGSGADRSYILRIPT